MTKKELKELIKEVIVETDKMTPKEATWPANIAAKEIGVALKSNPIYKNVDISYLTRDSEGASGSVYADLSDGSGGSVDVWTYDAPSIRVSISNGDGSDNATRIFNSVSEAIKFLRKNPMSVFEPSRTDALRGATILSVVDKGKGYGKIITIVTKDGKKITGKFSI